MSSYILSIDQGTSSTRTILFSNSLDIISSYQLEHQQLYPQNGYIEHNVEEIWSNIEQCLYETCKDINPIDIKCIGITNQRETCLLWNKDTGIPYENAIVWNDIRTIDICNTIINKHQNKNYYQKKNGLPITTYFSLFKLIYLLQKLKENITFQDDLLHHKVYFGTIDTYIIYKLTNHKVHITDVTNASRTFLMNIYSLTWDNDLLNEYQIPIDILPTISSSGNIFGYTDFSNTNDKLHHLHHLHHIPITAVLGDQHAALFGQTCYNKGEMKCTYGTGAFLLMNTGNEAIISKYGLLTTIGYQLNPNSPPIYALEGSVAYSGSTIQWLRDNLQIISSIQDSEVIASSVTSSENIFFVPSFSGLFAPYWRSDSRGLIIGLTAYHTKVRMLVLIPYRAVFTLIGIV